MTQLPKGWIKPTRLRDVLGGTFPEKRGFHPPYGLLRMKRAFVMKRLQVWAVGLAVGLTSGAAAFGKSCAEDRTPLEMSGHTLCLLNTAMPKIFRREDSTVRSLSWAHPERFPSDVKLPPGTFHLNVELGSHIPQKLISPSLEESELSDLPQMRETTDGLAKLRNTTSVRLHPLQARLNGQPFVLECREAVEPRRKGLRGHDCQLISQFVSGIWLKVHLGTVDWAHGPAWPRLDETWVETWPPYLSDLESGISNLLSIQQ